MLQGERQLDLVEDLVLKIGVVENGLLLEHRIVDQIQVQIPSWLVVVLDHSRPDFGAVINDLKGCIVGYLL